MPPVRRPPRRAAAIAVAVAALSVASGAGCAAGDPAAEVADRRAGQARAAALEAGLGDEVAEFMALAARAATASYQVAYPGDSTSVELVVTRRGADVRVDVVEDGQVRAVQVVVDGQSYTCTPAGELEGPAGTASTEGSLRVGGGAGVDSCRRSDAVTEPPGAFTDRALDETVAALRRRLADYSFRVEERTVAGARARCLVTALRPGRAEPGLAETGELCVAPGTGVVLVADRGGERVVATGYGQGAPDGAFDLPL